MAKQDQEEQWLRADEDVRTKLPPGVKLVRTLRGHTGYIGRIAWSPNGRMLASTSDDKTIRLWDAETDECLSLFEGHSQKVNCVAWSPNGKQICSGGQDGAILIWDLPQRKPTASLRGVVNWTEGGQTMVPLDHYEIHMPGGSVQDVSWSPDGATIISGSNGHLGVWDARANTLRDELRRNANFSFQEKTWAVVCSPSSECFAVITEVTEEWYSRMTVSNVSVHSNVSRYNARNSYANHDTGIVRSLVWLGDEDSIALGCQDGCIRIWHHRSRGIRTVMEGHAGPVLSVSASADGKLLCSASADNTVRLWRLSDRAQIAYLPVSHSSSFAGKQFYGPSVAFHPTRPIVATVEHDAMIIHIWELDLVVLLGQRAVPTVTYTSAKVLLVGESGVGKTGLSKRLASDVWEPSDSTVGAWATQWKLPVSSGGGIEREIWLWDFGGQADQRLIHQLYMDETALAVLVFDGQKEDLFETLGQWDRDLTRASRKEFAKLLVAGRVDAGGLRASRSEVEKFAVERKFRGFLETSAKKDLGCEELKQAILAAINWDEIPCRTTEVLFKRLKEEIIRLKDEGRALMRFNELRETLQLRLSGEFKRFADEELRAVLTLLAGPGVVWELAFGSWVLLQPERINAYAQAVIRTLQADDKQRGCLMEERVLKGDLAYESSMPRLAGDEERFVLLAMHQTLVERGLCLRQPTDKGNLLVFPSYYRRERPDIAKYPAVLVNYRFTGFLDEIYATLVVRLHHTEPFQQDQLWRYAADFKTNTGKQLGVKLTRRAPGVGELEVYFDPAVSMEEKIIFSKYVHEHLLQQARDVERLRHYVCPKCATPVGNREVAMKRLNDWLQGRPPQPDAASRFKFRKGKEEPPSIICVGCEQRVPLWDEMEQCFASPEIQQRVRDLQEESAIELSNQSKERALVGEVISTVALADQISREFNVSDQGIDMEVEFTDDAHEATGAKLYLQLKSGDSYLRERKSDGAEIFTIKDERHARYWMAQAFPVLLVVRNAEGEVRWMEVRDWLKCASNNGKKPVKQIVFAGERFDVMSVRRWREKVLSGGMGKTG